MTELGFVTILGCVIGVFCMGYMIGKDMERQKK